MLERRGFLFGLGAASAGAGLLMRTPAVEAAIGPLGQGRFLAAGNGGVYGRIAGPVLGDLKIVADPQLVGGLRRAVLNGLPVADIEELNISVNENVRLAPVPGKRMSVAHYGRREIDLSFAGVFPMNLLHSCYEARPIPFEWAIDGVLYSGEMVPSQFEHGIRP